MAQKDVGNCCFCIPLRTGVALLCMYHFVHSFICIVGLFIDDVRFQSGGYNPVTERLQVTVGACGIVFAISGLLGVYDNKVGWILPYNYFQYTKLIVGVLVFVCDWYTLQSCDNWKNNLDSHIHYNPSMETVSTKGVCEWTRLVYFIGWITDMSVNSYFTWVSYTYCAILATMPGYSISFQNDAEGPVSNHLHIRFFDKDIGEPVMFYPKLQRPQNDYGSMVQHASEHKHLGLQNI